MFCAVFVSDIMIQNIHPVYFLSDLQTDFNKLNYTKESVKRYFQNFSPAGKLIWFDEIVEFCNQENIKIYAITIKGKNENTNS